MPSILRSGWLGNLLVTLATGFILFCYSERVFWTVWRPSSDSANEFVITWLAYSVIAYLFLAVVHWSCADNVESVFLAGAYYGWLVEGGLIYTVYGTEPSAPLPLSISITGLSWHALISVMLGWWLMGRALRTDASMRSLVLLCVLIGVFWGLWAMFPRREDPPILTSVNAFYLNALLLTGGLIISWWVSFRWRADRFRAGWFGSLLSIAIVALFYIQHVQALGVLPLILFPLLMGTALFPLLLHRRRRANAEAAGPRTGQLAPRRLLVLLLIPAIATATYGCAVAAGWDRFPITAFIYYWLTGPLGFLMLALSLILVVGNLSLSACFRRLTGRTPEQ